MGGIGGVARGVASVGLGECGAACAGGFDSFAGSDGGGIGDGIGGGSGIGGEVHRSGWIKSRDARDCSRVEQRRRSIEEAPR